MSQFSLPLDSAALDRLEDKDLDRVRESAYQDLIEQGRAALVLRDELASRSRVSAQHATHHDDCGCLTARYEARIATLEAALAAANELADGYRLAMDDSDRRGMGWMARANALRDALEGLTKCVGYAQAKSRYGPLFGTKCLPAIKAADAALLATPAASLAEHDAEVLERGCAAMREVRIERPPALEDDDQGPFLHPSDIENLTRAIKFRALAAQAATRSELEVKP